MLILPFVALINLSLGVANYVSLSAHSSLVSVVLCALNILATCYEGVLYRKPFDRLKILGLSFARSVFFIAAFLSGSVVVVPGASFLTIIGLSVIFFLLFKKSDVPTKELIFLIPFLSAGIFFALMFQIAYWTATPMDVEAIEQSVRTGPLSILPRYRMYAVVTYDGKPLFFPVGSDFIKTDILQASMPLGGAVIFVK